MLFHQEIFLGTLFFLYKEYQFELTFYRSNEHHKYQTEQNFQVRKEKQKKFVQVEGLDLSCNQALALDKKNETSYSWTKP